MKRTEQKQITPHNLGRGYGKITVNVRKTGRNEKCPCGSNLKFKKCCLD